MADYYVDENGVARPDQPSKKDGGFSSLTRLRFVV